MNPGSAAHCLLMLGQSLHLSVSLFSQAEKELSSACFNGVAPVPRCCSAGSCGGEPGQDPADVGLAS